MAFNFGAAILRSMGDTRRPLYILVMAGVVNTLLNLLFVIGFGMGVAGVAVATGIANAVSATLIIRLLRKEKEPFRLHFDKMKIHGVELSRMLRIGVPALRIISYSFLFAGYCIVATAVFQALGHGVLSLVVSVVRQLFVLLPVAFLLSRVGGLDWVWWAFPIAELVAVVLCTVFLRHVYHKEIAPPAGEREAA